MAELMKAEQKVKTVRDLMVKNVNQLRMALPRHLTPDRFIRLVMTEIARNPKLLECTPNSLFGAVIQSAQLGLEIGLLGQAYLVPFQNRKRGTVEVQFIPGYKGLISLTRRSREISTIQSHVVYKEDRFEYAYGLEPKLIHVPSEKTDPGPIVYFYAIGKMKDGGTQFEVMSKVRMDQHRDHYSRAAKEGPWVTNYEEMGQKTVLRRLCKLLPMSVEMQTAVALDELAEAQIPQDLGALVSPDETGDVVDAETVPSGASPDDGKAGGALQDLTKTLKDSAQKEAAKPAAEATQTGTPILTPSSAATPPDLQESLPTQAPPAVEPKADSDSSSGPDPRLIALQEVKQRAAALEVPIEQVEAWVRKQWGYPMQDCSILELQAIKARLGQWPKKR